MREVSVHLEDEVVLSLERPAETGYVGGPQSQLLRSMDYVDLGVVRRDRVDDRTGPVGRPIVDDQNLDARILSEHRGDQPRDVEALVVRRNDYQSSIRQGVSDRARGRRRALAIRPRWRSR